jgi:cobalt-zinc-cadmium efflux system membrane fusion protein
MSPQPKRDLLSMLLALTACGGGAEAEPSFRPAIATAIDGGVEVREDSLPFIEVASVGDDQVGAFVRGPGRVEFREGAVAEVGTPVDGRVTEVHVSVGQTVEEGEPLVTIASPSAAQLRSELARARVLVRAAEAELARQRELSERGVGIASELVRAEAEVAEAKALLAGLSSTTASIGRGSAASVIVRAPITGTVLVRSATVGASVSAGANALAVLGEPGSVWVVASVFERDLALVTVGASATISLASRTEPATAQVVAIGGAVDPETRRAPVYLSLDPTVAPGLRPGMYARTEIDVGEAGFGVPTAAVLIKDGGRTVVFVQTGEHTFEPRAVHIGAPVRGRAPIIDGLEAGERIVVRGALLIDGQAELLR